MCAGTESILRHVQNSFKVASWMYYMTFVSGRLGQLMYFYLKPVSGEPEQFVLSSLDCGYEMLKPYHIFLALLNNNLKS